MSFLYYKKRCALFIKHLISKYFLPNFLLFFVFLRVFGFYNMVSEPWAEEVEAGEGLGTV